MAVDITLTTKQLQLLLLCATVGTERLGRMSGCLLHPRCWSFRVQRFGGHIYSPWLCWSAPLH